MQVTGTSLHVGEAGIEFIILLHPLGHASTAKLLCHMVGVVEADKIRFIAWYSQPQAVMPYRVWGGACMSEKPGSKSSSPPRPLGPASSSTAKLLPPPVGAACRSLVR